MKKVDRLDNLKEDFERLLQQAEPKLLPLFFTWIDLRISSLRGFHHSVHLSPTAFSSKILEGKLSSTITTADQNIDEKFLSDRSDFITEFKNVHQVKAEKFNGTSSEVSPILIEPSLSPINLSMNKRDSPVQSENCSMVATPESAKSDSGESPKPVEGIKINECNICHKQFQYRSSYRRHMKIHQGIFSHLCDICNRKFTRKEHFLRHKCNRRPNKPNRAGSGSISEVSLTEAISQPEPMPLTESSQYFTEAVKEENSPKFNKGESRRKSNKPRKIVPTGPPSRFSDELSESGSDEEMIDEDAYPISVEAKKKFVPFSNAHWATNHDLEQPRGPPAADDKCDAQNGLGESVLTLDSGSYKVQAVSSPNTEKDPTQDDTNSFIKVVKQGNYLKLKSQMQIINGKLCFVCPNCNKIFHRSSNFSRHMRIHRGIYSYVCPTCHRGFFRKEHYQKHKCHRKSMSHIWNRKTKLDMDMFGSSDNVSSNNESEPGLDADLLNESGDSQIENDSSSVLSCDSKDILCV